VPEALDGRGGRGQGGFTLLELLVVMVVIAVLMAVATPIMLEARNRARDRAAQATLRHALTAEKAYFADRQAYTQAAAELVAVEPSLSLDAAADANPTKASVSYALVGNAVVLGTQSASGACFYLKDDPSATGGGTRYGSDASAPCPKPSAKEPAVTLPNW
jgi:type IV pilus assembly protein PilA